MCRWLWVSDGNSCAILDKVTVSNCFTVSSVTTPKGNMALKSAQTNVRKGDEMRFVIYKLFDNLPAPEITKHPPFVRNICCRLKRRNCGRPGFQTSIRF